MKRAIERGDAQTIENMVSRDGIDVNADLSVSTIIPLASYYNIKYVRIMIVITHKHSLLKSYKPLLKFTEYSIYDQTLASNCNYLLFVFVTCVLDHTCWIHSM